MPKPIDWTRRELIGGAVAAGWGAWTWSCSLGQPAQAQAQADTEARSQKPDTTPGAARYELLVREEAGLRRFGYPVHTQLVGRTLAPGEKARLLRNAKPIAAQFRPVTNREGRPALALDFTSNAGPLEEESYVVEIGPEVKPGPEPGRGVRLERLDSGVRVTHGKSLGFVVGDRPASFLTSVSSAGHTLLEPGSLTLALGYRDHPTSGTRPCAWADSPAAPRQAFQIEREGPTAIGLRLEGEVILPLPGREQQHLASDVRLSFPSSKSWVEATWWVDDPEGLIGSMRIELKLAVDGGGPTLVDLGAASTVYGVLKADEGLVLTAGSAPGFGADRPWNVQKRESGKLRPLALATAPDAPRAEGWAHVMDHERCAALAVGGFGHDSRDSIAIDGDGKLSILREFAAPGMAPPRTVKRLTCWLHFVGMPLQIGAATSPQAMLAPLKTLWREVRL